MTPFETDVRKIIADYKEELAECSSEYARRSAAEHAFNEILAAVETCERIEKEKKNEP